nr:hypothetical protein [Bacteroides acidifaciens]
MDRDPIDERKKFVEAWNKTMLDIWQERIFKLKVMDSGSLWRSPLELPVRADGRFYDITLSQTFLEYGLWQDLGVGREVPIGNGGDIGRDKKRVRRRWFSTKYYASVMALRDFMAESLGQEFVGMFANLDADDMRRNTDYYRRKGLG